MMKSSSKHISSASFPSVEKMETQPDQGALQALRIAIDAIDAELLPLLNRRAGYSLEVGRLKAQSDNPVFQPAREQELLSRLLSSNTGPLQPEHLCAIYREILSASRSLQQRRKIAFLGPEGTFSHVACLEYFGHSSICVPMQSLADVFSAVENRDCDLGVIPLENSVNGAVGQSLDLFSAHEVTVQAEWFSRIRLSLMSRESLLERVNVVCSHPQPLGQCAAWLRARLPGARLISVESTAAAALRAAAGTLDPVGETATCDFAAPPDRASAQSPATIGSPSVGLSPDSSGIAAIGHAALAERLGLNVLASSIEDASDNWTRFFAIAPKPLMSVPFEKRESSVAVKSSILFSLADAPGTLVAVLQILADAGINLSKLESRPMRGERWKYLFFADLDGDITAPEYAAILAGMRGHCTRLRVLGVYPAGRHIHATE